MLGIGFAEMVVIAGVALIVIGPEKFPDFAKLVIRTIRDLRGYVDDVKREVSKELQPIKKEMDALSKIDPERYIDSLTAEADKKQEQKSNPGLHEEDQKILNEAAMYAEEPYGWQGEDRVEPQHGGDATVEYGQDPAVEPSSSEDPAVETAAGEPDQSGEAAGAESETGEGSGALNEDTSVASEFERHQDWVSNGEPDVWTGR